MLVCGKSGDVSLCHFAIDEFEAFDDAAGAIGEAERGVEVCEEHDLGADFKTDFRGGSGVLVEDCSDEYDALVIDVKLIYMEGTGMKDEE